ncbi:MAG: hypothetical protein QNL04_05390 [SAR324 cluster bacterium]|nr:hypothetical protein [SAR324 cluster bacterium]
MVNKKHGSKVSPLEKSIKSEFDYLVESLVDFLKTERKTLLYLSKANIEEPKDTEFKPYTGWERWLQIAWPKWMTEAKSKHFENKYHMCLEVSFDRDGKKNKEKVINRIDLVFLPKQKQEHYIGIELKVGEWADQAIRGGIDDIRGYYELKPTAWKDWGFRCLLAVVIYRDTHGESKYEDAILLNEKLKHGRGFLHSLPNDWKLGVFGWEPNLLSDSTRDNFNDWYKAFADTAKERGLNTCL